MQAIYVGIDIGGTNSVFGIVDSEGKIIAKSSIKTDKHEDPKIFVKEISEEIKLLLDSSAQGYKLSGIGIGAPNGNFYTGSIEFAPNLKWKGVVKLAEMFSEYFDCPVKLTNDANAAAIGEMQFGGAKGMTNFIMVTLGTGLGSGFVVNGELVYGADGFAGELGHTIYDYEGRPCGCGRKGCLETYASAGGIVTTAREELRSYKEDSELKDLPKNELTSKRIYEAAKNGDKLALIVFDKTAEILGRKLADVIAITSPEAIFLFGGLALAGDILFKPTNSYMEENCLVIFKNKVKLLPSLLPENDAAVLGAAALVLN